jgi:hypothetical protein
VIDTAAPSIGERSTDLIGFDDETSARRGKSLTTPANRARRHRLHPQSGLGLASTS